MDKIQIDLTFEELLYLKALLDNLGEQARGVGLIRDIKVKINKKISEEK